LKKNKDTENAVRPSEWETGKHREWAMGMQMDGWHARRDVLLSELVG